MAKIPEDIQGYDSDPAEKSAPAESGGSESGYSYAWMVKSAAMLERGWRMFCKKRGMDPDEGEWMPSQRTHVEVMEMVGRRGHA